MKNLDNSDYEPIITFDEDGIRLLTLQVGIQVPIYDFALYRAVGMLPEDTPDYELTELEMHAQSAAESYQSARKSIDAYIDQFTPSTYEEIIAFIEELAQYLEKYNFDPDDIRLKLHDRLLGPIPQVFTTGDPEIYLLYRSVGIHAEWEGEGPAPTVDES